MIFDTAGHLRTSVSLAAGFDSVNPFTFLIECRTGYRLYAAVPDDVTGVAIKAKANVGDAFQNIESDPIDLTPYAGTTRAFLFEVTIAADAVVQDPTQTFILVSP